MKGHDAISIIERLGLSKAEASRVLGVSTTAVQKWATGDGGELHGSAETMLRLIAERPELVGVIRGLCPERWKQ